MDTPDSGPRDTIEFAVAHGEVTILVNGRDLVEMARELELPFAEWEGNPELAGSYRGLGPADVLPRGAPSLRSKGGGRTRCVEIPISSPLRRDSCLDTTGLGARGRCLARPGGFDAVAGRG